MDAVKVSLAKLNVCYLNQAHRQYVDSDIELLINNSQLLPFIKLDVT